MPRTLLFRAQLLALALALSACASKSGVSRSDARVAAPPVVTEGASTGAPEISTRAKLFFEDAVKAFEAQTKAKSFDYPALKRKFQTALDADENLAEAEYNLGVIAEREGDLAQAVTHYKSALRKKPTLKQAAENLAVIAQNKGDVATAVAIYKDILTLYPEDASSRARLGEIYRQSGEHERAMEMARQALIREPKTLAAYKVMMRSYLDRRQVSVAKLVALRALKLDENDPELYHTVGLILLKENEIEKARSQFAKAVQVRADYHPSHVVLAKLALEAEDYPSAEEHLRRVLQADGKNAEAHLNLGVVYKGMGQFDKAMQEYDLAEQLNPSLAAIYLNRAVILHRNKDAPERGLELYKKYVSMTGAAPDSKVFALIGEAQQLVSVKEEAKRMEEEAKRQEELAKEQEKEKAQEQKLQELEKKDGQAAPQEAKAPEKAAENPVKPAVAKPAAKAPEPGSDEPEDQL